MNNLPGVLCCIRLDANPGATCIRTEMKSLKILANMRNMIPHKYFPVFVRVRIQAPDVFAQKIITQEFFPACIGSVPGDKVLIYLRVCYFFSSLSARNSLINLMRRRLTN